MRSLDGIGGTLIPCRWVAIFETAPGGRLWKSAPRPFLLPMRSPSHEPVTAKTSSQAVHGARSPHAGSLDDSGGAHSARAVWQAQ